MATRRDYLQLQSAAFRPVLRLLARIPNLGAALSSAASEPPMTAYRAKEELRARYPVWRITLDGRITHANLLAFWLWGALAPDQPVQTNGLIGLTVFQVFARNFERLPVRDNQEMFRRKIPVLKQIERQFGDTGTAEFVAALKSNRALWRLYNTIPADEFGRMWQYSLHVLHPLARQGADLLHFQTTIHRIQVNSGAFEYLVTYDPLNGTAEQLVYVYDRLLSQYGERAYVVDEATQSPVPVVEDLWRSIWGGPVLQRVGRTLVGNGVSTARATLVVEGLWVFYSYSVLPIYHRTTPVGFGVGSEGSGVSRVLILLPKREDLERRPDGMNNAMIDLNVAMQRDLASVFDPQIRFELQMVSARDDVTFEQAASDACRKSGLEWFGVFRDDLVTDLKQVMTPASIDPWLHGRNSELGGRSPIDVIGSDDDRPIRDMLLRLRYGALA